MMTGRVIALCLASAGLGGCGVTSQEPLFAVDQASKHPLRDGLWAITNPGCEVKPLPAAQALPECVGYTMTVAGSRLDMAMVALPFGLPNAAQLQAMNGPAHAPADFVLVDGDPAIVEVIANKAAGGASAAPAPTPLPGAPGGPRVSYMSLRSLEQDAQGRIVRGVMWSVPCPDAPGSTPGFKTPEGPRRIEQPTCLAETPEAVRTQAPHMKPFMSFFVTWVR